jgi:hypothetical protein
VVIVSDIFLDLGYSIDLLADIPGEDGCFTHSLCEYITTGTEDCTWLKNHVKKNRSCNLIVCDTNRFKVEETYRKSYT